MRLLATVVFILATAVACTPTKVGTVPVDSQLSVASQSAQTAVNELNVLLNAAAREIGNQARDGIMPRAEAQAALDQLRSYARQVDAAQAIVETDPTAAKNQADLIARALTAFHKKIAEKARQ